MRCFNEVIFNQGVAARWYVGSCCRAPPK